MAREDLIYVENSTFIYATNFSGDPDRDHYHNAARKANIILPDIDQAMELRAQGFNVKETKPRRDDDPTQFTPEYYISINLNFNSKWPPVVYLIPEGGAPVKLDENSVAAVDRLNDERRITKVNAVLNPYESATYGTKSMYARTIYIEHEVEKDPFRDRYNFGDTPIAPSAEDDIPF